MVLFSFSFNLRSFLFFVISFDWTNAQRNSKKNSQPSLCAEPSSRRCGRTICCRDLLAAITSWCAPTTDTSIKANSAGIQSRRFLAAILAVTYQKLHRRRDSQFCDLFQTTRVIFFTSFCFFLFCLSSLFKRNDQCTIRMQEFAIRPWVLVWKS